MWVRPPGPLLIHVSHSITQRITQGSLSIAWVMVEGKERIMSKIYVHVTINESWLKGFLQGINNPSINKVSDFSKELKSRLKNKESGSTDSITLTTKNKVVYTINKGDFPRGRFYTVSANGEWGIESPKGANLPRLERETKTIMNDFVEELTNRWLLSD